MISGIDKYFKPIVIQRPSTSTDEWGQPIQVWNNHITVQGLFRELSGNEIYVSKKDTLVGTHRLYCRVADIKQEDRVVFKGETYSIINVKNVMEFDQLLMVDCEYDNS